MSADEEQKWHSFSILPANLPIFPPHFSSSLTHIQLPNRSTNSLSLSLSPMAAETLTDYERRRLDNIRRNREMMSSLNLPQKSASLSQSLKRPRPTKSPKLAEPQSPIVLRRSSRIRSLPPSSSPSPSSPTLQPPSPLPARKQGPLLISDALVDCPASSDRQLLDQMLAAAYTESPPQRPVSDGKFDPRSSLSLNPKNVAKVVPDRILSVRFFPYLDRTVVVAGNKLGHVGIWDADSWEKDAVYLYSPHSAPVSGISIHPSSATKMYTSSYDGYVRLMDVENETFNMIFSTEYLVFSICQSPNDNNSLYMGEGVGDLKVWDGRSGKVSSAWHLHDYRVNTIDFNPQSPHMMATSSTDTKAYIWDLRKINKERPEFLKKVEHDRSVNSAFFSPGGSSLATTSIDDRVGLLSGDDFDDLHMIKYDNHTGRGLSSSRAIWGWDDSFLYMGNMKRAIDVISTADRTTTALESEHMTCVPCRFAAHPFREGSLAGGTAGGKVYLWTKF